MHLLISNYYDLNKVFFKIFYSVFFGYMCSALKSFSEISMCCISDGPKKIGILFSRPQFQNFPKEVHKTSPSIFPTCCQSHCEFRMPLDSKCRNGRWLNIASPNPGIMDNSSTKCVWHPLHMAFCCDKEVPDLSLIRV